MGKVLTLLYHRVRNYEEDVQLLAVTPEHFSEQMSWLKENYKIIGFGDNWDQVEGDAVCITFDDGYRDNFLVATPILNQWQIPATVFVSTGNIDTGMEMWWDELERNFLIDKEYQEKFSLSDEMFGCTWNTSTRQRRKDLYDTLHWLMRQIEVERRNNWIAQLQDWNGYTKDGREENHCVRREDLCLIDTSQILIGAHTVNHPVLSKLSAEEQKREIEGSKCCLENILSQPVLTFSYPFGSTSDYNEETIRLCKNLGFSKVAANVPGIWRTGSDLFQIPRHIVRDWNIRQFKEQIKMFWEGN